MIKLINTLVEFTEPLLGIPNIIRGFRLIVPLDESKFKLILNYFSDKYCEGQTIRDTRELLIILGDGWAFAKSQINPPRLTIIVDSEFKLSEAQFLLETNFEIDRSGTIDVFINNLIKGNDHKLSDLKFIRKIQAKLAAELSNRLAEKIQWYEINVDQHAITCPKINFTFNLTGD